MSINEIDVKAVNERTRKEAEEEVEPIDQDTIELAAFMKGSLRWRIAHLQFRVLMTLESLVWTIMDTLRARRMRLAARINSNYRALKKRK